MCEPSRKFLPGPLTWAPFRVDDFKKGASAYFLTHAHMDHLQGLTESWRCGRLYCTSVTRNLLLVRFPCFDKRLVLTLEVGETTLVSWSDPAMGTISIAVTVIDANHCPGSCMFLFESKQIGRVLHTGDFRFERKSHIPQQLLEAEEGTDTVVYLDNTYGLHRSPSFPSRDEVKSALLSALRRYSNDARFVFVLHGFGKEELVFAVALAFKTRVLVTDSNRLDQIRACNNKDWLEVFTDGRSDQVSRKLDEKIERFRVVLVSSHEHRHAEVADAPSTSSGSAVFASASSHNDAITRLLSCEDEHDGERVLKYSPKPNDVLISCSGWYGFEAFETLQRLSLSSRAGDVQIVANPPQEETGRGEGFKPVESASTATRASSDHMTLERGNPHSLGCQMRTHTLDPIDIVRVLGDIQTTPFEGADIANRPSRSQPIQDGNLFQDPEISTFEVLNRQRDSVEVHDFVGRFASPSAVANIGSQLPKKLKVPYSLHNSYKDLTMFLRECEFQVVVPIVHVSRHERDELIQPSNGVGINWRDWTRSDIWTVSNNPAVSMDSPYVGGDPSKRSDPDTHLGNVTTHTTSRDVRTRPAMKENRHNRELMALANRKARIIASPSDHAKRLEHKRTRLNRAQQADTDIQIVLKRDMETDVWSQQEDEILLEMLRLKREWDAEGHTLARKKLRRSDHEILLRLTLIQSEEMRSNTISLT